jgi:hypothetical protein
MAALAASAALATGEAEPGLLRRVKLRRRPALMGEVAAAGARASGLCGEAGPGWVRDASDSCVLERLRPKMKDDGPEEDGEKAGR